MARLRRKQNEYGGLLAIGDPHLDGRKPGFRCDNYPEVILDKLQWCLDYAADNKLLPVLLGDMFDKPRDNPNWMMTRLIDLLAGQEIIGIFGNHDCRDPQLTDNDSLQILVSAHSIQIVSQEEPWVGTMSGRRTIIGGSSYRAEIPTEVKVHQATRSATLFESPKDLFGESAEPDPFVAWITHHDIVWEKALAHTGSLRPFPIKNCDLLINGHIHRKQEPIQAENTTWINPGNISRRSRGEATKAHVPSVLRVDVGPEDFAYKWIEVPHKPFEKVFYEEVIDTLLVDDESGSRFIHGIAELTTRRTDSGVGLVEFLDKNLDQFETDVASAVKSLAQEVLENATQ